MTAFDTWDLLNDVHEHPLRVRPFEAPAEAGPTTAVLAIGVVEDQGSEPPGGVASRPFSAPGSTTHSRRRRT
jgi:hypothetical protein